MSFATVNGVDVVSGSVTFRLRGAWDADLVLATDDAGVANGTVVLDLGGALLSCVASFPPEADAGNGVRVRLVGGRGGLTKTVDPIAYISPSVRQVVADALGVGGEVLASTSDPTLVERLLPRWTRARGEVGGAVQALAAEVGASWRILFDGSVWLGFETWGPVELEHTVEEEELANGRIVVFVESVGILPGVTWAGRQVSQVVYQLTDRSLRAVVSFGAARDELVDHIAAIVRRETAGRDHEAPYVARVLAQNADGSLELRPNDARMPSLSKVPVRLGMPGIQRYQFASGVDVVLEFEDGNPQRPIVTGWNPGVATALSIGAPDLRLGSDAATDPVVLLSKIQGTLNQIQTWAQSHTHPVSGAVAGATTNPLTMNTDVGATKVKAE